MREFIGRNVNGVLARTVAAMVNLDVLHGERSGVHIGAEYAMRGAVVNDRVTNGDVVSMMVDAAKRAAGHIKALKDIMIR